MDDGFGGVIRPKQTQEQEQQAPERTPVPETPFTAEPSSSFAPQAPAFEPPAAYIAPELEEAHMGLQDAAPQESTDVPSQAHIDTHAFLEETMRAASHLPQPQETFEAAPAHTPQAPAENPRFAAHDAAEEEDIDTAYPDPYAAPTERPTFPSDAPSAPAQARAASFGTVPLGEGPEEASSQEEQDRLKAFLQKKREEGNKPKNTLQGAYSDDPIAYRYLRPIMKYIDRPDIEDYKELIINKPNQVIMERANGTWEYHQDDALSLNVLEDIARVLANRTGQLYHPGRPILSCKMEGGHRVQIVGGFNTITGFIMAVRIQRKEKFTIDDFQMEPEDKQRVIDAIQGHKTILISGGTGTGKTSFMNACLPYISDEDRLVTLEDVPELRVPQPNWCPMLFSNNDTGFGNQDIKELLNATLRLRPDRIILGEIRKENAFTFCSAINTGHEGSMATIHANSPATALDAVINRVLLNGDTSESALGVLRRQLIADIYGVVQLTRLGAKIGASFTVLHDNPDVTISEQFTKM